MSDRLEARLRGRIPAVMINAMHEALGASLGAVKAAQALRAVGVESGDTIHRLFQDWLSQTSVPGARVEGLDSDEFWKKLGDFLSHLGWGSLEQSRLHPGVLALSSSDWVEANSSLEGQPCCHFTTGFLAGLLQRVAGRDLAVLEVECRASGQSQCRFLVGSSDVLDAVYESLRAGARTAGAIGALR